MECLYYKQYFAKNLCYLFVETQNEFSDNKKRLSFIPYNFDLTKNLKYKSFIKAIGEQNRRLRTPIESIYEFYYFSNRAKALHIDFTTVLWYNKYDI